MRRVKLLLAASLAIGAVLASAAPAQASARSAAATWNCFTTQNLCLFYGSFNQGSYVFFQPGVNDANLADNIFTPSGAGQGQSATNNTRSAANYTYTHPIVLCSGINYSGVCRILAPNDDWSFDPSFWANVESFYWGQ